MYRCISKLKGLVIDIETFHEDAFESWKEIYEKYKCLFLVTNSTYAEKLKKIFGEDTVYQIAAFVKLFAPSPISHEKALNIMNLKATEIAYVSKNRSFLDNAMSFLGGTIWITDKITYDDAGKAPDLICPNFSTFKHLLLQGINGFLGEVLIYPNMETSGMIIPLIFEVDEEEYPMYMLGRYFGYSHYMSQLHPYSSTLYLNKNERGKAYGKYNEEFAILYACAVEKIQLFGDIDGVVSVPTRPGKIDRFESILEHISDKCSIKNLSKKFNCLYDYPTQKSLSTTERQTNIEGVFQYKGDLTGKHIILIDDIVTTGATIRECISVLKKCGAEQVTIVVLAINQIQGYYWSSNIAEVSCSNCGAKMHLLINSKNKNFFYSCYECHGTKSFDSGREELINKVNNEIEK